MDLTEKQISFEYKFKGKIVNLRVDDALLPNGTTAKREIVEHNGGVCVAPLDSEYNLYFVKQFRYPYMEIVTELPAGKLEKGEDPFEAGKRDFKEETGAKIEILLQKRKNLTDWEVVARPTKRLKVGTILKFSEKLS